MKTDKFVGIDWPIVWIIFGALVFWTFIGWLVWEHS
jgi:hypothetical protein